MMIIINDYKINDFNTFKSNAHNDQMSNMFTNQTALINISSKLRYGNLWNVTIAMKSD